MNLFHESKKILDKDGKVNPLGPYGRQKLTGREVSTYFRRNPVKDAQIKKAVEVALDLQGAMTVASKEIKKFYGDKILRSKEVQKALKYANESVEHDIREDLQEVSLGNNMLRKDFPNVWATKDAKLYRVLFQLVSQDGFVDNMKSYKKNPKDFVDSLRKIAKNPKKYEKSFGRNFAQYINNPKPGQAYAKLPEENIEEGKFSKYSDLLMLKARIIDKEGPKSSKLTVVNDAIKTELKKLGIKEDFQEEVRSVLGEAPYDKADVKKVKGLEKKLRNMLKEVDKVMRGSGLSAPAFSNVRSGITKGLQSIEKFYKIADKDSRKKVMKNPRGYVVAESLNEVTDKEINMAKKLSKDMEKVKKGYQQIAKTGDKTLKNTGFNPTYEAILKAQQKVLSLIGELNTMKMMSDRAASRQKDSKGRPIMNSFDAYRDMQNAEHCELVEGKVLKFTKVKDKSLEKHLKVVTKKVGAKLEKISGGFAVSDTDMRGFTAVVDYIFDKSIKKNMLDGGGMSDVTMTNESVLTEAKMSKEMPLDVYAKKVGIDKKEQDWIMKNEKAGGMYYNNSMFPSAYSVLSYPIYDKDYYFAFIGDSMRENAQANAEMNRELRRLKGMKATPEQQAKGFKDVDALFAKMYERFGRLSSLGAHDTMTREELSFAVSHIKTGRATNELAYEYDLMKAVDGGTFFEEVSDKKQETFTEGRHGQMLRNIQMKALKRKSRIKGRAGAFESMSHNKLNVMDEYAKMYEDMVQKAREKKRLSDTHRREKEALAKKHARMKEQKELDEGMIDLDKARKLPDNIQKQILDLKREYDRTWDGVFVPMGKEGSSQRKEYERRGKVFKAASKKYKDFLKKHKVATFK